MLVISTCALLALGCLGISRKSEIVLAELILATLIPCRNGADISDR